MRTCQPYVSQAKIRLKARYWRSLRLTYHRVILTLLSESAKLDR